MLFIFPIVKSLLQVSTASFLFDKDQLLSYLDRLSREHISYLDVLKIMAIKICTWRMQPEFNYTYLFNPFNSLFN